MAIIVCNPPPPVSDEEWDEMMKEREAKYGGPDEEGATKVSAEQALLDWLS